MRIRYFHFLTFIIFVWILATVAPSMATETALQPIPSPDISIHSIRSDAGRPIRTFGKKYKGKIWDTHVHLDPPGKQSGEGGNPDQLLAVLEKAGIHRVNIMPTPNEGSFDKAKYFPRGGTAGREALHSKGSRQIRVFCGAEFLSVWMGKAATKGYKQKEFQERIIALDVALTEGRCHGIGEIGLFHFNKSGRQLVLEVPPTFPPFLSLFELATSNESWVDLHAEPVEPGGKSRESEVFGIIALLYKKHPNLKLILSHTAMTNPTNLEALFTVYPSLMVNFKLVRNHERWKNLEPNCDPDGRLYEDWAVLMEAYPDRFLVGSDAKFGRKGFKLKRYQKEIRLFRKVLGGLDSNTARKIAWENAVRVFGN